MISRNYWPLYFLIIIFFLIVGCKTTPYQKESDLFNNYLLANFEQRIEKEKHYYFIANSYVCKGCIKKYLHVLNSFLVDNQKRTDIYLITTLNYNILNDIESKVSLMIDKDKNIDYENLNLHDLNLYITQDNEIKEIYSYSIEQEDSYRKKLNDIFNKRQ